MNRTGLRCNDLCGFVNKRDGTLVEGSIDLDFVERTMNSRELAFFHVLT
jgi:hypothetical protein